LHKYWRSIKNVFEKNNSRFGITFFCFYRFIGVAGGPGSTRGLVYVFFNKKIGDGPFGLQGDFQFRFWNAKSDLKQIFLRTGATCRPENTDIFLTLGHANISTDE
jgi:hypothetical protein